MAHKLLLASAGAGKSSLIAQQALYKAKNGHNVLILSYTDNNQKSLLKKICRINGSKPSSITIKGWFTFLLEDMIRPYQKCIFEDRIQGIHFNSCDPHKREGRTIPGRSEKVDGCYNPIYFLTLSGQKVHTTYLSKLAARIHKETGGKTTHRLARIYDDIYIDEVQDLVGWDFDVIKSIVDAKLWTFVCVGDFRQTIYTTAITSKKPQTNLEKLEVFKSIGFELEDFTINWRCIQSLCDFADLVHAGDKCYAPTCSQVKKIPDEFCDHQGLFAVPSALVHNYLESYDPVILRRNRVTGQVICDKRIAFNFGEAKGLSFNRVIILPTEKHKAFLSGKTTVFDSEKTEKAKNTFYVAITRARYSVAFVYDGNSAFNINVWAPN